MDIALNRLTGLTEFAKNVKYDNGNYLCKICSAPVVWVNSSLQKPHFRHFRGQASSDCEYYTSIYLQQNLCNEENQVIGLKFKLDVKYDTWALYLYLPEFRKDDIDTIGISGFHDIKFMIDNKYLVDSANLWPGKRGFLCNVSPHSNEYNVKLFSGNIDFDFSNWLIGAKGLDPSGIFFRHPLDGGWIIRTGDTIDTSNTLYLLAHNDFVAVPVSKWPETINRKELNMIDDWRVWEINFPEEINEDIVLWLKKFDYSLLAMGYKIELMWPTPYSMYSDGSFVIDSENVLLNIRCIGVYDDAVLFHKHDNGIESYMLDGFVNKSMTLCLNDLKQGLHRFFIDRFSNSIDIIISPKNLTENYMGYFGVCIKIGDQIFNYCPYESEIQHEVVVNAQDETKPISLEISGKEGMKIRVQFQQNLLVKHVINAKTPLRIDNISELTMINVDAIILDFLGIGVLKINFLECKFESIGKADEVIILGLLEKVYLMSKKEDARSPNFKATRCLDNIYKVIKTVDMTLNTKNEIIAYVIKLRQQYYMPWAANIYLFDILDKLQNQTVRR